MYHKTVTYENLNKFADGQIFCKKCKTVLKATDPLHTKMCRYCDSKASGERVKKSNKKKKGRKGTIKVLSKKNAIKQLAAKHRDAVKFLLHNNETGVNKILCEVNLIKDILVYCNEFQKIGELEYFCIKKGRIEIDKNFQENVETFGYEVAYGFKFSSIQWHNFGDYVKNELERGLEL